jgi:hypothetical protein
MCRGSKSEARGSTKLRKKAQTRSFIVRFRNKLVSALGLRDDVVTTDPLNHETSFPSETPEMSIAHQRSSLLSVRSAGRRLEHDDRWVELVNASRKDIGRRTGGAIGFGIGSIVLLPFGPIAMCLFGILGLILGILAGLLYDTQRIRFRESAAEKDLKRLTYLVRFASDQINKRLYIHSSASDGEYCMDLLETVILEFRPFVQVAHLSSTVLKKLRLLHSFLCHQTVRQCLWMYVNGFLSKWANSLTVMEFIETCQNVLQTLVDVEAKLGLIKTDDRLEVIVKVDEFLAEPLIKLFLDSQSKGVDMTAIGNLEALLVRDLRKHMACSGMTLSLQRTDSDHDEFDSRDFLDSMEVPETVTPTAYQSPVHKGRAFFRSFKDFMDFDLDLKHRLPITIHEARFLYEKEAEPHNAPGWELTVNKANINVLRFISRNEEAPVLVRAYAKIPNMSIANVFYHIVDPEVRPKWDQNFSMFSLIPHAHDNECEILYCTLNSPFGVTPRDFLQYRKSLVDNGVATIMMRSAVHEDRPPSPGYIRAESLISGYVIRQVGEDVELFLMSQTDIKGLIPKWMVNMFAAKAPAQWVENLAKSCKKLKDVSFGGDIEKMKQFLDDYLDSRRGTHMTVERFNSLGSGHV